VQIYDRHGGSGTLRVADRIAMINCHVIPPCFLTHYSLTTVITIENVSKSYDDGTTYAVHEMELEIARGELLVLLGESGCGKTTTLKMINRLIEQTSGDIIVDGVATTKVNPVELRRGIGYVIQGVGLFPHMTVAENVGVVLQLLRWDRAAIDQRVDELMNMVGLPPEQYARRRADELSGGQRQRVGVARALAARPRIMLMDEPFGALDPLTRDGLQTEFLHLQRALGLTVVLVTHDMVEALLMADRIAVMERGRMVAVGTPQKLLSGSSHPYVEALMQTPRLQAEKLEKLSRRDATP